MMIDSFLSSKQMVHKSENTKKSYKRDLSILEAYINHHNVSLDSLNDLLVQQFINHLKESVTTKGTKTSPATINRMYAAICSFCHWSKQTHAIEDISIDKVAHISKQPSKGLSEEEITKLRLSIANDKSSPTKERDQAILDFLLYSGCRVSELVALDLSDIIYKNGIYTILIHESKGNESRKVYMDSSKFKYIKRYLDNRNDSEQPLFLSKRGRISIRMVQTVLSKYGINPHMARHTFCSILARNNIDPFTIAALAGHKDMNTTRRYANPTEKEMAEAVVKAFNF